VRVQSASNPSMSTPYERPIVALDHRHGGPHHLRQLKDGDACGERVRRKRRAQVVDAGGSLDTGRLDSGRPHATAEVVEVEHSSLGRGEQERAVESRGQSPQRGRRSIGERSLAAGACGLASSDDQHAPRPIHAAAFDLRPFQRAQPCRGDEGHERAIVGT
jgi:hypothetical protein